MPDVEKHLAWNNFEAWVNVDNKALIQYGEEFDAQKNEASCWIASATDQAFSFSYQKKVKDEYEYKAKVYLDDNLNIKRGAQKLCVWYYRDNSPQNIGEIKIVITKVKITSTYKSDYCFKYPIPDPDKIHERSKKGLAHRIKYGPGEFIKAPLETRCYKKKVYGTIATFVFRYRPIALLQANGIAPRASIAVTKQEMIHPDSSPRQSGSMIEISDEEPEEDPHADIIEREKALLAELEQVRRERMLLAELEQIRVAKRAAGTGKNKRPKKRVKVE